MRLFGILADYEDQNDHDTLRTDPVFQTHRRPVAGRRDLASQPTLSRFENAIDCPRSSASAMSSSTSSSPPSPRPPRRLTFDIDAVDDPAHGAQQLVLFHGYFEQYQYLPLGHHLCARTMQMVMVSLRHGTAPAALGADDDVEYLVSGCGGLARRAHPGPRRCGFGVPWMYDVCERLDVEYTFGLAANAVLQRETRGLIGRGRAASGRRPTNRNGCSPASGIKPAPGTAALGDRQGRGQCPRNQRVSSSAIGPAAECLEADLRRLRDARREREPQQGTQVRPGHGPAERSSVQGQLLPAVLACGGLESAGPVACKVADPPPLPAVTFRSRLTGTEVQAVSECALTSGPTGRRPPGDVRVLLIKAAAAVVVSCRRIVIRLSGSWPYRAFFERVRQHVCRRPAVATPGPDNANNKVKNRLGARGRWRRSRPPGSLIARNALKPPSDNDRPRDDE